MIDPKERYIHMSSVQNRWRKRAKIVADILQTENTINNPTILDLGCGDCKISSFLTIPHTYIGSDFVKRTENTLVCDLLNLDQVEKLPKADIILLLGVLESVDNINQLLAILKTKAKYIYVTYRDKEACTNERVLERKEFESIVNNHFKLLSSQKIIHEAVLYILQC